MSELQGYRGFHLLARCISLHIQIMCCCDKCAIGGGMIGTIGTLWFRALPEQHFPVKLCSTLFKFVNTLRFVPKYWERLISDTGKFLW